jgi:SAM-dependent methyltransferase
VFDWLIFIPWPQFVCVYFSNFAILFYRTNDGLESPFSPQLISSDYAFPVAVDLGAGSGSFLRQLVVNPGIQQLIECDSAANMLTLRPRIPPITPDSNTTSPPSMCFDLNTLLFSRLSHVVVLNCFQILVTNNRLLNAVKVTQVVCDEEFLPFAPQSVDLVVSCLALHWCNDIANTFYQIQRILKPNGVFIGAVLGGDTLHELR